jgi:sulfur-oxidizing protein SoxA
MRTSHRVAAAALAVAGWAVLAQDKDPTIAEIEKYREMLADGNPAELYEARGEELWKTRRGPNNASLEQCDLGLGPGVVKGAYARMPRYFADTDKVQDLESRLVTCMVTLQGFKAEEVTKRPYGSVDHKSELEALTAYVVGQSRGMKMNVSTGHPKEKEAFEIGRQIFYHRGGPYDFACATCHGEDGKRIRLQDLPNLTTRKGAQLAYTSWPAYRVSQGELRTMQWRLWDCFRQQRFPEPKYGSDATIALTMYLAASANGGVYNGPGIKR